MTFMKTKQIAFSKIILPSGEILKRHVVVFDENNQPTRHFPLSEEIAFTEWQDRTFYWTSDETENP